MNHKATSLFRDSLRARSEFLGAIRRYFLQEDVLEVETPLLRFFTASDPNVESISVPHTQHLQQPQFLQTSPEATLKSMLALGSGSIFQLAKVFRDDPAGRWHKQEFTMLEWYRVGYSLDSLMADVMGLLAAIGNRSYSVETISYRQLFIQQLSVDPFSATIEELKGKAMDSIDTNFESVHKDDWLDLLFTHRVQHTLGLEAPMFVVDYPPSQASLSATAQDKTGEKVAKRAELYWRGIELANAYQELVDCNEFERRYQQDIQARQAANKLEPAIDQDLLEAMRSGLPVCSGVALGVDRLFALLSDFEGIV